MTVVLELAIAVLLVLGGCFGLIGSFGLLKLRAPMQRLHAPTKALTMGVASVLIASALDRYLLTGAVAWQNIMVAVFLFITAPISALYLAKAHLHTTVDHAALPKTTSGAVWSVTPGAAEDA